MSLEEHDFHDCTIIDGQIVTENGKIFVDLEIKSDNFLLDDFPLRFSTNDLVIMLKYAREKHLELKQKIGAKQ